MQSAVTVALTSMSGVLTSTGDHAKSKFVSTIYTMSLNTYLDVRCLDATGLFSSPQTSAESDRLEHAASKQPQDFAPDSNTDIPPPSSESTEVLNRPVCENCESDKTSQNRWLMVNGKRQCNK